MEYTNPLAQYIQAPPRETSADQKQDQQQQALIEALRGVGAQGGAGGNPMQAGNVVSANGGTGGLQSGMQLGSQIGQLGSGINQQYGLTTAMKYGTSPGSQQTMQLAAQDAGF